MSQTCIIRKGGGKGNRGMFTERDPIICGAGVPTAQPGENMAGYLQHYLLQDAADALIGDAITSKPKPPTLPPLRHSPAKDIRNAGYFTEIRYLINPVNKTKYEMLAEDFKTTTYSSYWKKPLGAIPDPTPLLPKGFDIYKKPFGKKTKFCGRLYDVILPIETLPDVKPELRPSFQIDRRYCKPAYNPNIVFGKKTNQDVQGRSMKCCLTNDEIKLGTDSAKVISATQTDFKDVHQSLLGAVLTPNDNISSKPKGFRFGKISAATDTVQETMTTCKLNPEKQFFKQCLGHLNTVRKVLSKRLQPTFYKNFYLSLKYFDTSKSGWLAKNVVYDFCATKLIRFDPSLIEPLLSMWKAFDGVNIDYEIFVRVFNHREPSPEIPKIWDVADDCLDFRTTYSEMIRSGQEADNRLRAGLPSGRYLDLNYPITPKYYCKADVFHLPEESDAKACLNPSNLSALGVSHRDMFAAREPGVVRRVFEAAGETFTDDEFDTIWKEAECYHYKRLVCYETFHKAILKVNESKG